MKEIDSKVRLIDLETIQTSDICKILCDYYIDAELDGDGDVLIKQPEKFFLKVDPQFIMLRFFSFVTVQDQEDPEFLGLLDDVNSASSSVKYSRVSNSVMMEYGIPLFGYIDHKHLIKLVSHFEEEMKTLKMVLHGFLEE